MCTIGSLFTFKYGYRQRRTDLRDSLKTLVFVTEDTFRRAINDYGVVFRGYDPRCHQFVFEDTMHKINWVIVNTNDLI